MYNSNMDRSNSGEAWGIPEYPHSSSERAQEIAAELCDRYDEISFAFFNKILDRVREEANSRTETPHNLGRSALLGLEVPKIPEK